MWLFLPPLLRSYNGGIGFTRYLCPDYTKLQGATENLHEPHNLGGCNIIHPRNLTTLEVLGTVFSTGS